MEGERFLIKASIGKHNEGIFIPVSVDVLWVEATWEGSKPSNENVISFILSIQETLAKMSELAHDNLSKAQQSRNDGMACTSGNDI